MQAECGGNDEECEEEQKPDGPEDSRNRRTGIRGSAVRYGTYGMVWYGTLMTVRAQNAGNRLKSQSDRPFRVGHFRFIFRLYTRSPGHAFRVAKAVGRIAIQGGLWTWETASAAARLQLSLHPRGEHLLQVHTSYTLLRSASEYPDRQLPALAAGVRPRRR